MTKKVDEYVQIPDIFALRRGLKDTGYTVIEALNRTNILKELINEKEEAIQLAKEISKSLVPEIQLLSTYLKNEEPPAQEEEIYTHRARTKIKNKAKKIKSVTKQVNLTEENKTLQELKRNLAKIRRQLNE